MWRGLYYIRTHLLSARSYTSGNSSLLLGPWLFWSRAVAHIWKFISLLVPFLYFAHTCIGSALPNVSAGDSETWTNPSLVG